MQYRKTVGVLGGMGPAATAKFFNNVIDNTVADSDQEHVNMIIMNDTQIPDRTEYILGKGPSPIPSLIDKLNKLYLAGADVAVIPCMTAHTFISELQKNSPIPIVNAIKLLDKHLDNFFPNIDKIGLLATSGSIQSGVYKQYISKKVYIPEHEEQEYLMSIIYGENGIKAGNTSADIIQGINEIIDKFPSGIEVVVAGCTELSIVMNNRNVRLPVLDPMYLLAKEVVRIGSNHVENVT